MNGFEISKNEKSLIILLCFSRILMICKNTMGYIHLMLAKTLFGVQQKDVTRLGKFIPEIFSNVANN